MGTTKVTHEQLTKAAQTANDAGQTITLNLTRLLNEIETQATSFQGAAGSTFQHVSADLGQELRKLLEALNRMAENVQGTNAAFGTTDEAAQNEINRVQSTYEPGAGSVTSALRG